MAGAERHNERLTDVLAALAVSVFQVGISISLAALIFAGPLAGGAARASSALLIGTAVLAVAVGWFTRMRVAVVGAQDTSAVVLAAIGLSIAGNDAGDPDTQVATLLIIVALGALLTAFSFLVVARRRLTGLVRYLPWPVVTGYTAGTGWLLLRGGIEVTHGSHIKVSDLGEVLGWGSLQQLLPGLALAAFIVAVMSSRIPNVVVSVGLLLSAVLFHLIARSVTSLERLEADGWLIGPFDAAAGWAPIGPSDVADADWGVVAGHTLAIVALVFVGVIGLLLNLSGLESTLDCEIEMDHEVTLAGIANIGVAAAGGVVGWHFLGDTTMADRLGARGRSVAIAMSAMCLGAALLGPDVIGLMPRAVAGGVLAGVGLNMLVDWGRVTMPRLSSTDRMVSTVILAAMAILGVLPGVAVGIALAAFAFIRRSSLLNPARNVFPAAGRSAVDRSLSERALLVDHRHAILAVELQGFLFFGSTMRLRDLLDGHGLDDGTLRHVVIDFGGVTGIDSTAAAGLAKLVGRLGQQGVVVGFSGIAPSVGDELRRNGLLVADPAPDLDHGIAIAEDLLLDALSVANAAEASSVPPHLAAVMQRRTVAAGTVVIGIGDAGRELFFVERGRLTTSVTNDDGHRVRLRQVNAGAVLGEITFARDGRRTADVVADTEVELLVLTRSAFDQLVIDDAATAVELQQLLLVRFANRLATTSAMVRDLTRAPNRSIETPDARSS